MLGYMIRIGMLTDLRIMYPEASYALVLSDMIYGKRGYASRDKYWKNFDVIKDSFSVITTYHKQEAEKLGISYVPQPYALKSSDIEPIIDGNYVLFVGNAKDRLDKIVSIYKKLTALGIICKFWINKVEEVDIGGTKVKFFDDFIVGTENETTVSNFENILLNAIKIIMKHIMCLNVIIISSIKNFHQFQKEESFL